MTKKKIDTFDTILFRRFIFTIFKNLEEFNELIQQKKIELTKLDEKLTGFEYQREQLEYDLDLEQQKFEDDRNELEEKFAILGLF